MKLYLICLKIKYCFFLNDMIIIIIRYQHRRIFRFYQLISFVVITNPFKFIVNNKSNENSFDTNYLKDTNKKK